jgi:hypothetical protein
MRRVKTFQAFRGSQQFDSKSDPAKPYATWLIAYKSRAVNLMSDILEFRCAKNELVLMRSRFSKGGPPTSIGVIGGDYSTKTFRMLYSDERGVGRHYAMQLSRTRWKLTRHELGFVQRFIGRLSKNRREIRGAWEKSGDGRAWQHDFALVYRKK